MRVTGRTRIRVIAGTAVVVALAALMWTWRTPTAFEPGGGYGIGAEQWQPGTAIYVGMSAAQPDASGSVRIHRVRPHDLSQTGRVELAYFVCTIAPSARVGGIGSADGADIKDQCASLEPAAGATLRLNAKPPQQLVVEARLPPSSQVSVHGLEVTYSHGWQRGTQVVGGDVDIKATPR